MNYKLTAVAILVLLGSLAVFLIGNDGRMESESSPKSTIENPSPHQATAKTQKEQNILSSHSNADNPLAAYRPAAGWAGRNALDEIYSRGVPKTKQSVDAARSLLAQGVSSDEKVALARILGSLYRQDDPTGENDNILSELRKLSNDANGEAAKMAAISYARLGYFNDSESVLDSAFERGALYPDDYYGELAHLVDIAPPEKRGGLTEKIKISSNSYASDILAMALLSEEGNIKNYSTESLKNISELFGKTEPAFPPGMGEFGLFGAMRYSNWLRASAKITSQTSGNSVDAEIINGLSQPNTDPRKIMAYLLTPESSSILEFAPVGSPAAGLVKIVNQYAMQFPSNPSLKEYAQDIARRSNKRPN